MRFNVSFLPALVILFANYAPAHAMVPMDKVESAYTAELSQTVLVISVDKETVQAMVGPEQDLLPQTLTDEAHNPVMIIQADYKNMVALEKGQAKGKPFDYDEFVVYVPNVQLKEGYKCLGQNPGPAAFMPVLYLNKIDPVNIGRVGYGLNKFLSDVFVTDNSFKVSRDGKDLYSAKLGEESNMSPAGQATWIKIASVMPQALMGRQLDMQIEKGKEAAMIWSGLSFGLKDASFKSMEIKAHAKGELLQWLKTEVSQKWKAPGVNEYTDLPMGDKKKKIKSSYPTILGAYRLKGLRVTGTQPVVCTH